MFLMKVRVDLIRIIQCDENIILLLDNRII